ncbi:hypothetical protein L1049_025929 [Liquidambar formosana]|uniref:Uncharacterized protein n=1 Tax=Liquidambar formosana TaxID=63359 RepID=A0AAP0NEJ8_LIQFO
MESMQLGLAMQHLGPLFLELGRTILTLRMGQSPAESIVNAGPAVYISPSGPNPIMVQPFPLQTSSLFGGSAVPSNPGAFGPVGIGNVPRHINIHIHAGTSLGPIVSGVGTRASNVDGMQGEHVNGTGSGDSGAARPVRNVLAAAVPTRPNVVATSVGAPSGLGVSISQPPPDSVSLSTVIAEVNSQIRNFVDNMRGTNQNPSGQSESSTALNSSVGAGAVNDVGNDQQRSMAVNGVGETSVSLPGCSSEGEHQKPPPESHQINNEDTGDDLSSKNVSTCSVEGLLRSSGETSLKSKDASDDAPRFSERNDVPEGAQAVPLGLGLGGLQPKRRSRQPKSQVMSGDGGASSTP